VEVADVGGRSAVVVAANTDVGVLRGSFALLPSPADALALARAGAMLTRRAEDQAPAPQPLGQPGRHRRARVRGPLALELEHAAGRRLAAHRDYARANASIGINGTVLNNVNSNAQILTAPNLDKVAALANALPPVRDRRLPVGAVQRADRDRRPAHRRSVERRRQGVVDEEGRRDLREDPRLRRLPGEGQRGGTAGTAGLRPHARDGANMLSDALGSHGGIVLWRAFVYTASGTDRIRQAYDEFKPLDGKFGRNTVVQVKNGPLDFQPREPPSPLFGALPGTPVALELQITKEYLGADTHLAYLGPLYQEVLKSDTYANGPGSLVARVVDGTLYAHATSAILGGRQRRQRRQLDRFALQPGQLVRVRPHGVGIRTRTRGSSPTSGSARPSPATRPSSRR
jgi:alpha-glucuronidase